MSEIADFLRARYAERRLLALAASPGLWHPNEEHDEVVADDGITVAEGFALSGQQLRATVDHIATHDPIAVIADLDAKLALVDLCTTFLHHDEGGTDPCAEGALRILAQPFAGQSGRKGEEWAP